MLGSGLQALARGFVDLVFPNRCGVCGTDRAGGAGGEFRHSLCAECHRAVTTDPHAACPFCAATVGPHADTSTGCATCRGSSFGFDAAVRLGPYEGQLRDAVLRMKSIAGEGLAEQLGRVFWEARRGELSNRRFGVVVPVPLHWSRRFTRGYNQAEALGRELALGLGIAFAKSALERVRNTPQQGQPTASARRDNVKGAFRVARCASIAGKGVLLVDDVMTTGSTASEAAKTLKLAGAESVVVAALARR
ncbi:phosphoribosyltransferase : Putative amidophosphoribosyltransferase OS=Singulisphaera acidiphila (strain ATCC BAA-1392 / DSM 18658 / VKM B-2454 / MOB10) GN=Sinac_3778 PE=4 SV=1: Pribosyltran [Gemmataceae bacterium]|nr:phosphoribosyltransferase : Putative amidophosphoribosyltransferase OS=Singulisphaera acidiphila (strain ATCC BAA-1392 / DSM 18658 / VKM B-2454 / MOB10) GN=Sinac_3778 PE=4 SV=1: Pribosyltran [Gemmataceae bacterium]VTT98350.1 phosphoribosyltransferase : Putative amidophosphoribosyltransferase OS=Singulisphaera acidiphila (strain ATCC BAA-1392 / DSM 18658 / VKM B-2454 / MOB10) GN=Sinac_3778 PE=4 SV=1: Pribosyltran [Gemmataceae bacterium]